MTREEVIARIPVLSGEMEFVMPLPREVRPGEFYISPQNGVLTQWTTDIGDSHFTAWIVRRKPVDHAKERQVKIEALLEGTGASPYYIRILTAKIEAIFRAHPMEVKDAD